MFRHHHQSSPFVVVKNVSRISNVNGQKTRFHSFPSKFPPISYEDTNTTIETRTPTTRDTVGMMMMEETMNQQHHVPKNASDKDFQDNFEPFFPVKTLEADHEILENEQQMPAISTTDERATDYHHPKKAVVDLTEDSDDEDDENENKIIDLTSDDKDDDSDVDDDDDDDEDMIDHDPTNVTDEERDLLEWIPMFSLTALESDSVLFKKGTPRTLPPSPYTIIESSTSCVVDCSDSKCTNEDFTKFRCTDDDSDDQDHEHFAHPGWQQQQPLKKKRMTEMTENRPTKRQRSGGCEATTMLQTPTRTQTPTPIGESFLTSPSMRDNTSAHGMNSCGFFRPIQENTATASTNDNHFMIGVVEPSKSPFQHWNMRYPSGRLSHAWI